MASKTCQWCMCPDCSAKFEQLRARIRELEAEHLAACAEIDELRAGLAQSWEDGATYALESTGWTCADPPTVFAANPHGARK